MQADQEASVLSDAQLWSENHLGQKISDQEVLKLVNDASGIQWPLEAAKKLYENIRIRHEYLAELENPLQDAQV
jgi:hypothetical protein